MLKQQKWSVFAPLLALLCAACAGTPSNDPGGKGSETQGVESGTSVGGQQQLKQNLTALKKQLATKEKLLAKLSTFTKGRCEPQWDKLAQICVGGAGSCATHKIGDIKLCKGGGGTFQCVPNRKALGFGNNLTDNSIKNFCAVAGNDPDSVGGGGPHDNNTCTAPVIVSQDGKELVTLCQNIPDPDVGIAPPNICVPNDVAEAPAEHGDTLNNLKAYCAGRVTSADVEKGDVEKARFDCEKAVIVDGNLKLAHVKDAQGEPFCRFDATAPCTVNPEVANWCGHIHAEGTCNLTQGCGWNSNWSAPVVFSDDSDD